MVDLKAFLPVILPKAVTWGKEQENSILATGRPLTGEQVKTARGVGVAHPETIRVKIVPTIPGPSDPLLAQAAMQYAQAASFNNPVLGGVARRLSAAWLAGPAQRQSPRSGRPDERLMIDITPRLIAHQSSSR